MMHIRESKDGFLFIINIGLRENECINVVVGEPGQKFIQGCI